MPPIPQRGHESNCVDPGSYQQRINTLLYSGRRIDFYTHVLKIPTTWELKNHHLKHGCEKTMIIASLLIHY